MKTWPLFFLFFPFTILNAEAADLAQQPEPAVWLQSPSSPNNDNHFIGKMGDTSVLNPSWSLIQQESPIPISNGSNLGSAPGTSWQVSNGSSYWIQFYSAGINYNPSAPGRITNAYELAQNSAGLGCNSEWLLQLQAIPPNAYIDTSGHTAPSSHGQSATLDTVSNVNIQLGLTIPYEAINPNQSSGCGVNVAGYS